MGHAGSNFLAGLFLLCSRRALCDNPIERAGLSMKVKFWGVRGSLPTPGPKTARYGGNTTCLQVLRDSGPLIVLDAGTGVRELSDHLMKSVKPPYDIRMLVTHTHWDHIHGFPFFVPIYVPGSQIEVYGIGPLHHGKSFERVMRDQMTYSYFPVENTMLDDTVKYFDFNDLFKHREGGVEGHFKLTPEVTVHLKITNHPVFCLAYKLEADGKKFIFTGDHEPYYDTNSPGGESTDTEARALVELMNDRFIEFCEGVDLLVIDTTYTEAEYNGQPGKPHTSKRGWGHSTFEYNIGLAKRAKVRKLALTHHDPTRTDDDLDRLMDKYAALAKREIPGVEVFATREGMVVDV
ncbi:MAG: Ribonuclease BN [Planctomycetes bacterium]|nr:Ribonuclease BN [Planctomycetota bacterium]MCQ3950109.1 MBL fold metallo-hydrolase [Planctomycetota bacterium]